MAMLQRIESLKKRHAHLEHQIHQEFTRPSSDDSVIAGLKRQKLRIRDEMVMLSREAAA